jgi:hypothetical protein
MVILQLLPTGFEIRPWRLLGLNFTSEPIPDGPWISTEESSPIHFYC